jgi:hypothetical protein
MHETVLDHCGLGVHADDVVLIRLIAGDRMKTLGDQFLDQLGAGSLVFDQHDIRVESLALLAHGALQLGVFHASAQHVQQVNMSLPLIPQVVQLPPFPPPHAGRGQG